MHPTAMSNGKMFFDSYVARMNGATVVEIGSQDVNGSLRDVCPTNTQYIGVDFVSGKGVDVVLTDPYKLPFESESVDVIVSSSCFEHSEMFWLVFCEVLRILKPDGLFYLNVPSNGAFHRYPVDCWRFFPDAGNALVTWAKHEGMKPALLESYTSMQRADIWNDFVAVFVKDEAHVGRHPDRIVNSFTEFSNGKTFESEAILNASSMPEDIRRTHALTQLVKDLEGREAMIQDVLAKQKILLQETRAQIQAAHERSQQIEAAAAAASHAAVNNAPYSASVPSGTVEHGGRFENTAKPASAPVATETLRCTNCGGVKFDFYRVLPPELVDAWQLSPSESEYINRQQAQICTSCGANLRSIALADAIRASLSTDLLLRDAAQHPAWANVKILEINEAGTLSPTLRRFSGYSFGAYPEIDIHAMPYPDASFDLVVHSDTLEHVANPIHALEECRRILKPGGTLCFTVPVVVGRLTRSREGLPKSFHGDPRKNADDYLVHTEYGADAWTHLMLAGFTDVTIHAVAYPAATAFAAKRT